MYPPPWTKEEKQFALEHISKGMGVSEISRMMKNVPGFHPRTPDAIWKYMRRYKDRNGEEQTIVRLKDGPRLTWTQEETDYVLRGIKEGKSASVIAKEMIELGMRSDCSPITRNAVIGVWNRNKEIARENLMQAPKKKKRIKKVITKKPFRFERLDAPMPPSLELIESLDSYKVPDPQNGKATILTLKNNQCRFPFDDPKSDDFHYCGEPINYKLGRSYCTFHHRVCYRPTGTGS